jgi:predicted secreted acid phosphatase
MVFVDFSNPYLRAFLASEYWNYHKRHLGTVRTMMPAQIALARAEEIKGATKPLAAVIDIDEIVLSNIHMNTSDAIPVAGSAANSQLYTSTFHACDYFRTPDKKPWPRDDTRLNPLLPGARKLIATLLAENVEVFFVTGRAESLRGETVENFVYVGLAGPDPEGRQQAKPPLLDAKKLLDPTSGQLVMCPDAECPVAGKSIYPFKEASRAVIEQTHHIVVNIGDQVSDMGLYGDHQVLVPHPFYRTP